MQKLSVLFIIIYKGSLRDRVLEDEQRVRDGV